ncbi:Spo0B domain-containing protein [Macrococcoides canis]|uniref:Spo0B domain-containing protein n=1 Tax=Macrococcoides canis TaxID=1855823 RepID=UPI001F3D9855|nr:Spo0B domain-containing protein [Macrococcus canis]UJS27031.1 Spo0B domain-containing protein [Macrococcus canis]
MDRRDIYYKMKHDFANQLQLIDIYTQLGQHEKRDRLIQSIVMSFKDEQQFLKLPLNQTIDRYIQYKIEQDKFDFAFEIDTLSSAIGLYDMRVSSIFNDVIADAGHRIEEKGLITISIFETDDTFELLFVLTGRIINETIHPAVTEVNEDLIEYKYEINKRGV